MINKRVTALILGIVICFGNTPIFAQNQIQAYVQHEFESDTSNKQPDYLQVNVGSAYVKEIGNNNKALFLNERCNKVYFPTGNIDREIVISMQIKKSSGSINAKVGFATSLTAVVSQLFYIEDDKLKTVEGREFGRLDDKEYTTIQLVVNKRGLIDFYVNGSMKVKQWSSSATINTGFVIQKESGEMLLDNVFIYKGNQLKTNFEKEAYEKQGDAYIDYDYRTNADYAYVDTENLYDKDWRDSRKYRTTDLVPKGNKITLNRLEQRLNPDRENGYVILEKTMSTDVYIDFKGLNDSTAGYCPYYLYTGNLKVEKFGSPIKFAYFRDNLRGSNADVNACYINANGQVVSYSGKVVKTVSKDEWLNFWIYFDLAKNNCDLYINGELVDSFSYNANFKQPVLLRVWVDTGGGNTRVVFDKLKVLGLRNPFDPENPDKHPSYFSSDDGIVEFLKDKTAFYAYSENVFSNGEKHIRVAKPIKEDNETEVYVPIESLNVGYGFDLQLNPEAKTAQDANVKFTADSNIVSYKGQEYTMLHPCKWVNDRLYVPVDTFSEDVLGYCVKNDENGLVITSKDYFYMNEVDETPDYLLQQDNRRNGAYATNPPSAIKVINWYMSFERPSAEKILADFNSSGNAGVHPRAIGTKEDFDRIRELKDTDSLMKKMVSDIVKKANGFVEAEPPEFEIPDDQRLLDTARAYRDSLLKIGFAYQATGDVKYAETMWKYLQKVLSFPDWNPSHMIDTGELTGSVAIGYDWCYDYFTEEQRQYIYNRIKELGIKPIADAQKDIITTRYEMAAANDFISSKSNFNSVINGGLLTATSIFMEQDPEYLSDVTKEAIRSLEYTALMFRPAGLWMESPGYWKYVSQYYSSGISSMMNSTGNHYGLIDAQGMEKTAYWIKSMASYAGLNNFHDAAISKLDTPYVGWYAKLYNIPSLSAATVNQVKRSERSTSVEDAIWYVPNNSAAEDDFPLDYWTAGLDTVSGRGSYTDRDAMFFSTHGGLVTCYHSQYDVGTYVLDFLGTRWIDDLGNDDYNVRSAQKAFGKMYRDIAEGHTVMVYDNGVPGQDADGCAEMTRWETKERGCLAVYDLKTVYQSKVSEAKRGFYLGDNRRSLTVRDEFTPKKNMVAHWYAQTSAKAEVIDNKTVILSKLGKKLKMEIDTNLEDYSIKVGDARPSETTPDIPGQNKNVGYSRIDISMNLQAKKPYYITVKYSELGEETESIEKISIPVDEWQLPDGEYVPRKALNVDVFVDGTPIKNVTTDYTVPMAEGADYPVISATPENPEAIVEVTQATPEKPYATIHAYFANENYSSDTVVEFKTIEVADTSSFIEIPIRNVEVSSTQEVENAKQNMLDGDYNTRWTSNNVKGEYAIFDLGTEENIDTIGLAFWKGNVRNYSFTVLVSSDGKNWEEVFDGANSGTSENMEIFDIYSTGRYIKIVHNGNTNNNNCNILEFRAFRYE